MSGPPGLVWRTWSHLGPVCYLRLPRKNFHDLTKQTRQPAVQASRTQRSLRQRTSSISDVNGERANSFTRATTSTSLAEHATFEQVVFCFGTRAFRINLNSRKLEQSLRGAYDTAKLIDLMESSFRAKADSDRCIAYCGFWALEFYDPKLARYFSRDKPQGRLSDSPLSFPTIVCPRLDRIRAGLETSGTRPILSIASSFLYFCFAARKPSETGTRASLMFCLTLHAES